MHFQLQGLFAKGGIRADIDGRRTANWPSCPGQPGIDPHARQQRIDRGEVGRGKADLSPRAAPCVTMPRSR